MPDHLVLGAVPRRADPRDGLVGSTLAGLPAGGLVATGSARRRAQLAALRPDLVFTDLRGNMARRVAVAEEGEVSAVVVAVAATGPPRLGRQADRCARPRRRAAPGRTGRHRRAVPSRRRGDPAPAPPPSTTSRVIAPSEPSGPSSPRSVGAARCPSARSPSRRGRGAALRVAGLMASGDGHTMIRLTRRGDEPDAVGAEVARALLEGGGAAIEGFGGLVDAAQ